ncbi:unnamed protein product [Cyclocybe aegerita]|uniref:Glycosyltransferase family 15 protein n=1 Tax=Cyclocybe aegerita TaxID=1973307 RepID=A0A8S0X2X0_CYCAE|nr:unnamed protein product [Cyclocybe aegerita]
MSANKSMVLYVTKSPSVSQSSRNALNVRRLTPVTSKVGTQHLLADPPLPAGLRNATFFLVATEKELATAQMTIREIEDRFNRRYHYPYVILGQVEFTADFKKRISNLTPSKVEFGVIPKEHWFQPTFIDEAKAKAARVEMERRHIPFGGSVPFRNLNRYQTGLFFEHSLMQQYKCPGARFTCDVNFDPFTFMEENNKTFAFSLTFPEYDAATIPTLWETAQGTPILELNSLNEVWKNFAIANMDFWRSAAFTAFFQHMDRSGGFHYDVPPLFPIDHVVRVNWPSLSVVLQRWTNGPVLTIALALLAPRDQIHFFDEIGYHFQPFERCPLKEENWVKGRCSCDPKHSNDYKYFSCKKNWDALHDQDSDITTE